VLKKAIIEKQREVFAGGIEAVECGVIDVSAGGHYVNKGIAIILIYDYFHGQDFKYELRLETNFNMFKLTSSNIKNFNEELLLIINNRHFFSPFCPCFIIYN